MRTGGADFERGDGRFWDEPDYPERRSLQMSDVYTDVASVEVSGSPIQMLSASWLPARSRPLAPSWLNASQRHHCRRLLVSVFAPRDWHSCLRGPPLLRGRNLSDH